MYNLKSSLRGFRYPQLKDITIFVGGGEMTKDRFESEETVLKAFERIGATDFFKSAIEYYLETGNSTRLDARIDEYLLSLAHEIRTKDFMFAAASLIAYYLECRQSAANVRTIVVGKNSGMNEEDIRANLRMAYVRE